jgi:hypothetical protein
MSMLAAVGLQTSRTGLRCDPEITLYWRAIVFCVSGKGCHIAFRCSGVHLGRVLRKQLCVECAMLLGKTLFGKKVAEKQRG